MRFREAYRTHPERAVDDAVYECLVRMFPDEEVIRQYKGWKRPDSSRAELIPDFLILSEADILIVEVKAKRACSADGRKVLAYMARAEAMAEGREVTAALVAPSFSDHIPDSILRWSLT